MTPPERFVARYRKPAQKQDRSLYLLFHDQRLLVEYRSLPAPLPPALPLPAPLPPALPPPALPTWGALKGLGDAFGPADPNDELYLGTLDGVDCYVGALTGAAKPKATFRWETLRLLIDELPAELVALASRAVQLLNWHRNHRHCGRCGRLTDSVTSERARHCVNCNLTYYPRISPAMIVAVVRDGRILLGRQPRFRPGLYSVLAGFVEPGETLEDCVRREVREESGIEVKGITYFASQSWPFPDSLMVAFTAEYAAGEIDLTGSELEAVDWYAPDNLPTIPGTVSVARRLIDWFTETCDTKQ